MARTTPKVSNSFLQHDGAEDAALRCIRVGSEEWYFWLEQHRSFSFRDRGFTFTARKEQRPGGWYWYAYRRRQSRLHIAYLGKSEELTFERLNEVGRQLARAEIQETHVERDSESLPASSYRTSDSTLLSTKLSIPQMRSLVVRRSRLIAQLDQSAQKKLTVVSAPAGFGKTTLLTEWAIGRTPPAAWVSLDARDNDLVHFWSYIIAALQTLHADVGKSALSLLYSLQPPSIESVLTVLINDLLSLSRMFTLVIDDYHLIEAPEIHTALTFFIDHSPPSMHLLVASRIDLPLPLAHLRVRNEIIEIRTTDLRFTFEEATTFLTQAMNLHLSEELLIALTKRTEGWIAGLQLVALSLQGRRDVSAYVRTFTGCDRYILDYLVEEVLQHQPERIQVFLLCTSLLERLIGSLCNTLTGQEDGQAMLETLEQANLFIVPLDTKRQWYRYHQLFADLLRYRLQQTYPDQIPILHRRAAGWYEQHGMVTEAVGHLLAAGDVEQAADYLEEGAETLLLQGSAPVMLAWLSKLPETLVRSRPKLCLAYAWELLSSAQFHMVEAFLQDAEQGLKRSGTPQPESLSGEILHLLGRIDAMRATVAVNTGDIPQAITCSRRALERLPQHDWLMRGVVSLNLADAESDLIRAAQAYHESMSVSRSIGNIFGTVVAMSGLGATYVVQGHLHQGVEIYQQALHLATQWEQQSGQPVPSVGKAHIFLSRVLREWNDLDTALVHATVGVERCQQWGHLGHLVDGYLSVASVKEARGDIGGALETILTAKMMVDDVYEATRRTEHATHNDKLIRIGDLIEATQAHLWILQGHVEPASRWVQEHGFLTKDDPGSFSFGYTTTGKVYTTIGEVLFAQGRRAQALQVLDRLLSVAERQGWMWYVVDVLAFQALILYAQGNTAKARTTIARALSLAEPENYVRIFIDKGMPMAILLQHMTSHHLLSTYASTLLGFLTKTSSSHLPELLSTREHDVLRCLAAGMSNREIAEALVITVGTVKWYVSSIYGKLCAHGRVQAVTRAREFHLLP